MQHRDAFLQQYHVEVIIDLSLPPALDAYRPVSCLKDGTRSVFLLHEEPGRLCVLKMQPTGQASSLAQEYEMLQSIAHPQIPKCICYFEEGGTEYLVREYVQGISLAELVMAKGPVDERACLPMILSLCNVLRSLHVQTPAIIHRDIKPQNVILSPDGVCHLVDFGIARTFAENKAEDTIYMGTRMTAPPEQFGFGQTDTRSDIYSLGMLIRYLLTGTYEPLPKQAASRGMRRIVARCTAYDPARRFASVGALRRATRLLQKKKVLLATGCFVLLALAVLMCWPMPPQPPALFTNPLLANAIRLELGLPPNAPIPAKRLEGITELVLCGRESYGNAHLHEDAAWERHDAYEMSIPHGDIADLGELSSLANLRTLVLDYQRIENIESLQALPIERLSLVGNRITDLSPLAECTMLLALDISQNPVEDCDALAALPALISVNLNHTNVRQLDMFEGSNLQKICLQETPVADYAPLRALKNLQTLEAGYLDPAALTTLTQVSSLKELTIHDSTPVKDFKAFAPLRSLQELDIAYCSFDSLEGLEQLPGLRCLNLTGTGIQDVYVLQSLTALTKLELRHTKVKDFLPLLTLPRLQVLVLEETQRTQAEEQLADAPFALEIRPY